MDPFSIATACVGLTANIVKTSAEIGTLIQTSREARSDLTSLSKQLDDLKAALQIIGNGDTALPEAVQTAVSPILVNCGEAIGRLSGVLAKHAGQVKYTRWVVKDKAEVEKVSTQLNGHLNALDIALGFNSL